MRFLRVGSDILGEVVGGLGRTEKDCRAVVKGFDESRLPAVIPYCSVEISYLTFQESLGRSGGFLNQGVELEGRLSSFGWSRLSDELTLVEFGLMPEWLEVESASITLKLP